MFQKLSEYLSYDYTTGIFVWKKRPSRKIDAGEIAGRTNGDGYRQIQFQYKLYYAHRLAWYLHYGDWPTSQLDHINRDKLDNRIENLREVTHRQNNRNKAQHNNGASFRKREKKWYSQISIDNKKLHLGSFNTEEEAQQVYKDKIKEIENE